MKAHYYFDWFVNAMPKQIAELLLSDLPKRKSLVTISAYPPDDEGDQSDFNTITRE